MSRSRRLALALVLGGLLVVLVLFVSTYDVCAGRRVAAPQVLLQAQAEGPLLAGAASRALDVPLPATVAGYGVPRASVRRVAFPVKARALVVQAGEVRVGLVMLDLLVGDASLDAAIHKATQGLPLTDIWVMVTHTHSGPGGYASNPVAQVAGTGLLRGATRDAVVAAAAGALADADRVRQPVSLRFAEGTVPELVGAREPPQDVDARLTRLVFEAEAGPVAQLLVFACHPTLVARPPAGLDPDWPGRLAETEAGRGHGVTLVLQGAVGNVSPAQHEENGNRLEHFVTELASAADALQTVPVPSSLGLARVRVGLPGPDAKRVSAHFGGPLSDNLLCAAAPAEASVELLRVGPLVLLGVPGEPSAAAGRALEAAAGAGRAVSLVNGYLGYVETREHLSRGEGEAGRQLLGSGFLDALVDGARAARAAL